MKKRIVLLLLAAVTAFTLASCGADSSKKGTDTNNVISNRETTNNSNQEKNLDKNSSNETDKKEEADTNNTSDNKNDNEDHIDLFANLSNYAFEYTSHSGGWSTSLSITANGDFAGYYLDSEYGETGDGYPEGTMYESNFTGSFVNPTKIDDYSYKVEINGITYNEEPGSENYADGMRTVYSDASGVSNAKEFVVYLPDTPVSVLPQGFKDWVTPVYGDFTGDTLGYYALYNPDGEYAFISFLLNPENNVSNND
ncbi:hypothetical protein SAMN05216249_11832 [Acetitomaculum ruminis DSM 5522]|uniref:Lipoprotein n=1 Tax=Acetitomaculum ruminis DSM 5522 TaxID=1120918 RepID=A0A1I0ZW34_9FIRM|nr:hypothetical protein [Acetitomaculum ruminis]SFB29969.1 hypothetical protein SAMN05216249_11832 [Acetitomaculum ruminis DSM 5522]